MKGFELRSHDESQRAEEKNLAAYLARLEAQKQDLRSEICSDPSQSTTTSKWAGPGVLTGVSMTSAQAVSRYTRVKSKHHSFLLLLLCASIVVVIVGA